MSERNKTLKPGWRWVKFGDVVHLSKARSQDPLADGIERYVGLEHIEPGDLRIRSWGSVADGVTFTSVFHPGQVLFGKRRAYQRKVAVADFSGVCSGDIYVLEAKDAQVLLPELLPFICQTDAFFDHAVGTSAGSLSPRTNWTSLADFEFALPPMDEQKRIVELLVAAELATAAQQDVGESLRELWIAAASRYFAKSVNTNVYLLGELLTYASDGPFGSDLKSIHYAEHGVRVIRQQNIGILDFKDDDKAYVAMSHYEKKLTRYTVKPNDILVGGIGDPKNPPGRACLAPKNIGLAINKAHSYCMRPLNGVSGEYIVNFLNSPQGLQQTLSQSQGTAQIHLTLKKIKNLRIPLPAIELQSAIVNELNSIYAARKEAAGHLLATFQLKKRVLQQLI